MEAPETAMSGFLHHGSEWTRVWCELSGEGALAIFAANELMDAGEHDITRVVLVNPLMRMKTRFPTAVLLGLFILSRVPVLDKLEVS